MKIGIITGSGLSASYAYRLGAPLNLVMRDMDINGFLRTDGNDITPYYREVVEWFKDQGIEYGSVGCNSYSHVGMALFKEYGIEPVKDITKILFNEVRKHNEVGWISTSLFRNNLPSDLKLRHISDVDQQLVDYIIFQQLAFGIVKPVAVEVIKRIVNSLGCKDVVFGCTDLSIMRNAMDVNIIDSVQLHLESFYFTH